MARRKTNNAAGPAPVVIRPQAGKQELFLRSPADICIYGGAAGGGKTFGILLECLRHVDNPRFEAVVFRQSKPQILSAGGLYATSQEIYPHLGAESVVTPNVQWRFQTGAKITFAHMFYEKEKYNWQGAQIPLLIFDELTHFTESQFFYLLSRNRSTCGVKPYIRATCNPDGESWVAKFIDWWIDPETGYADESRCGKLRYFVRQNNIIHWANSRQELYETFDLHTPEEQVKVKSVSFISAKLTDNEALMKHDPGYIGSPTRNSCSTETGKSAGLRVSCSNARKSDRCSSPCPRMSSSGCGLGTWRQPRRMKKMNPTGCRKLSVRTNATMPAHTPQAYCLANERTGASWLRT